MTESSGNEDARVLHECWIAELEYKAAFFEETVRMIADTTKDRKTARYARACLKYPKAGRDWPNEGGSHDQ